MTTGLVQLRVEGRLRMTAALHTGNLKERLQMIVELGQRLMRANLIRHFLRNWHSIVLVLLTLGLCLVLLCLLQVLLNTLHRLVQRHS